MKKYLFVLFSLVIVVTLLLSACGQPATPATSQVKLVLWTKEGGMQLDKVKQLVGTFEERNPGVDIEVINYDVEKLRENFQTAVLAGTGPDLLWTVNDHAGPFTQAGLLQPVDQLGLDLNRYLAGALEAVKLDGKVWGIPLSAGNHLMLLYNKKLIPQAPKDTDELVRVAKELTQGDVVGLAFNQTEPFWAAPWLGGYGGQVFGDGNQPTLNTEAMVNTFALLHDWKFNAKIMPLECDYNCADSLFKDGKAAMIINGDWSLGEYTNVTNTQMIDLGTAPLPKIVGADWPKPYTSGIYFMFPKDLAGDKLEMAKKFVNYVTSDEVQLDYVKTDKRLPSVAALFNDPAITQDPILKGSAEALSHGAGMPPQAEMRCVWDAWKPNLQAVMADTMTPPAAAQASQAAAETCVAGLE